MVRVIKKGARVIRSIETLWHKILCRYKKHDLYLRHDEDKSFLSCRWCPENRDITIIMNGMKELLDIFIDTILPENILKR